MDDGADTGSVPPGATRATHRDAGTRSLLDRVRSGVTVSMRGCSRACAQCLAGPTRVLLADGRTRPIAELRVGDAVVGTEVVRGRRRYVRTTVLAHRSTTGPAVHLRLAGGTEIVAGGGHRLLTAGWGRRWSRLRPGGALLGPGPFGPVPTAVPGPFGGAAPVRRVGVRIGRHPAGRARGRRTDAALAPAPGRAHTADYRRGYLCGVVRADEGPAAVDRSFPSVHLELEALGRAHHFLADLSQPGAPVGAAGCEPVAARGRRVVGARPPAPGIVGSSAGRTTSAGVAGSGRIAPSAAVPRPVADAVRWPDDAGDGWCAGFLAGVVDARGDVRDGVLRVRHHDEAVVGRVVGALHRFGLGFAVERGAPDGERTVRLVGGPAALLRFLRVADPAVSRCRDLTGADVAPAPELRVVAVEPLGSELPLFDVTTGTGDVVAEGVVSHNCSHRRHVPARPPADGRLDRPSGCCS